MRSRAITEDRSATPPERGAPPTVLLIEDDPQVSRFACSTLRLEGYRPYAAATGAEGLTAARCRLPSTILLDLMLPGMGGIEVLRLLKADPATAAIPVVIFSASTWGDEERQTRELGAAGYLRKPASAGELVAAVHRALGRG